MNRKLNMNKELTIEEQNHQILHNQKVIINQLEQIKKHIWNDEGGLEEPIKESVEHNTKYLKEQAVNYIHNVVLPDIKAAQAEQGEENLIGTQGLGDWLVAQLAQPIFEAVKAKALEYIGEALAELKKQTIPLAVSAADWLLDKLEDIIVSKYNEANEEQKQLFKKEISEKFPNSRLLGKLN